MEAWFEAQYGGFPEDARPLIRVIRNERIMPGGRKRNSVRYSIIDDEWAGVRVELEARMGR